MKPLILLPLILASCTSFKDCPREYTICDPKTGRCTCDAPTGSLPDAVRERGDRMPVAHEPQRPSEPQKPEPNPPTKPEPEKPVDPPKEPEKPQHPGKEPSRADYDNERDYKSAHDAWKEGR